MKKFFLISFLLSFLSLANLAQSEPIQTQAKLDGTVEADIVKMTIEDKMMTLLIAFRNVSEEEAHVGFYVSDLYFLNEARNKKYHPLADSKGNELSSFAGLTQKKLQPGEKFMGWVRFPSPPKRDEVINLVIPKIMPFDNLEITR